VGLLSNCGRTRQLLLSLLVGALIAGASVIAYINSEREMPYAAYIAVSILALFVFPGYILSAYISNNAHDANLILAALINWDLYGAVILWVVVRKKPQRKRQSRSLKTRLVRVRSSDFTLNVDEKQVAKDE
jgi:hypothetical protein